MREFCYASIQLASQFARYPCREGGSANHMRMNAPECKFAIAANMIDDFCEW
jgi:hypothetical protein